MQTTAKKIKKLSITEKINSEVIDARAREIIHRLNYHRFRPAEISMASESASTVRAPS